MPNPMIAQTSGKMMTPISECKTVAELLESPERWTKGTMSRRADGLVCLYESPEACQWCFLGALAKIYGGRAASDWRSRIEENRQLMGLTLPNWNDDPSRTHAEVLALVKELNL